MALVDHAQGLLDVRFGLKRGVKRSVVDGGGQLSVSQDVGISTDRGLESATWSYLLDCASRAVKAKIFIVTKDNGLTVK